MKLLALDGNSIVNRAFYGIKLLTTKDGHYTNGIYGFINILNRLIELEQPDGVAVAFDLHHPTFRHEKYGEYKAGRKGMPEELREQIPVLKELLTLMGYHCLEKETFEADDILGTLAAAAKRDNNECVIATGDRDSFQLVSENCRVLLTATKMGRPELTTYTPEALFEKYGLTPAQMIELKALMGDSSDHIPGVAGVGEKTATDLISRFGSIDYIYDNLDTLDIKDSVKAKLATGKDSAYLSRWLGTINCEVPICTDFAHYVPEERKTPELTALLTRLEFFKFIENMGLTPDYSAPTEKAEATSVKTVAPQDFSCGKALDIYADLNGGRIAFVSGDNAADFDAEAHLADIKKLLENGTEKRVYDNKSLYKWCKAEGINLCGVVFDSMLAGYLLNPSASSYDVARLAQEYGAAMPDIIGDNYEFLSNAVLHSAVCDSLTAELQKTDEIKLLTDIELPLSSVLGEMELNGFLLDSEGIRQYGEELEQRTAELEKKIHEYAGHEFNIKSPKQLGVVLFEELGLPPIKKTKSGYSTSAEVLEELKPHHPIIELLLSHRSVTKLKSTYCDGLYEAVCEDGRIRTTFNQTETRTGRISSLEPNLQNIPVKQEEGRRLRKFFLASDGYMLCDADYSQIELRVLAHMANDTNMINAFIEGTDIHTLTASEAFDIPIGLVTPLMRSRAKAVNFGIVYGIGAFSLSKDIGVTRKEADSYIKSYLATYPGVDAYMQATIEKAKSDGFVTTLSGRRRYLPELASSNHMLRSFGERVARNAPIQGTAADIIKIAMIKVWQRLKKENLDARLILQVHDELIVECRRDLCETVCRILEEEMQSAAQLSVPLTVDAHCGKTWFEAKE